MERKLWLYSVLLAIIIVSVLELLHGVVSVSQVCTGWSQVVLNEDLIELSSQYIHSVDEPIPESPKEHLLCILIHNRWSSRVNRDAIRKAWLNDYKNDSRVMPRFVIGTRNLTQDVVVKLVEEHSEYGDILLLDQHIDTYYTITRKLLYGVQWMDEHGNCEYVMKCDDDVMVRLGRIVDELASRNSTKGLYWGYIESRAQVYPSGKYADNSWDLCPRFYIPYALGGGYIVSGDLVHRIASQASTLKLYLNSDVSMGVWLAPYDIEHKHDEQFESYPPGTYPRRLRSDHFLLRVLKELEEIWKLTSQ